MKGDSQHAAIVERLLCGALPNEAQLSILCAPDELEQQLIDAASSDCLNSIARRVGIFRRVHEQLNASGLEQKPLELWSRLIPLTDVLINLTTDRHPCIVGIAGIPGTGKTSLARILTIIANEIGTKAVTVSLDDFYLTPTERERFGHKWRAVPGTHDLALLGEFVRQAKSGGETLSVPRYDTRAEQRLDPLMIERPQLVLFEGWFVGAAVAGYEFLADAIDCLLYLDADLEWAHKSRVNREARIREESNNSLGLSEEDTERFWQEALLPGSQTLVVPLKAKADLILTVDDSYAIRAVESRL